jgi:hypothetical protein
LQVGHCTTCGSRLFRVKQQAQSTVNTGGTGTPAAPPASPAAPSNNTASTLLAATPNVLTMRHTACLGCRLAAGWVASHLQPVPQAGGSKQQGAAGPGAPPCSPTHAGHVQAPRRLVEFHQNQVTSHPMAQQPQLGEPSRAHHTAVGLCACRQSPARPHNTPGVPPLPQGCREGKTVGVTARKTCSTSKGCCWWDLGTWTLL